MLAIVRRIKHFVAFAEELWQKPLNADSFSISFSYSSEYFGTFTGDDNANKKRWKARHQGIRAFGRLTRTLEERNLTKQEEVTFKSILMLLFSISL